MQCRNCRCYLDDEFRYCPRCGAPNALAWPSAAAPWVRRPAAVAGLALLLIGWLVALQRQLWPSSSAPGAISAPPAARVAELPSSSAPGWRAPTTAPPTHRGGTARRQESVTRVSGKRVEPPRLQAGKERRAPVAERSHRLRLSSRASVTVRRPSAAPPVSSGRPRLVAAGPTPRQHRRLYRRAFDSWTKPAVFVRTPGRSLAPYAVASSDLVVRFTARPYGAKTYVFIDGGKSLGPAPTSARFDRPGRHQVLFFAPTLGRAGRVNRTIYVTGAGRQWVSATMAPSREVARAFDR